MKTQTKKRPYRFGLIVLPLRLITGSSGTGVDVINSIAFVFSVDTFRTIDLRSAATAFGVEGVVFGVDFALESDFILAEPLGFEIHSK